MRQILLLTALFTSIACAPRQDPGVPIPPPVPDNPMPTAGN